MRDEWYDRNSGQCPNCGGTIVRTSHMRATRYEPGFEIWKCEGEFGSDSCGYEGEDIV